MVRFSYESDGADAVVGGDSGRRTDRPSETAETGEQSPGSDDRSGGGIALEPDNGFGHARNI